MDVPPLRQNSADPVRSVKHMDYNGGPYDRDPYDGAAAGGEEA